METVDYTTANAVTKIALTPTIVTSPTLTQAAKLVTTLMVIATMIAGTVAVTKVVAILLSATMVAVITTATLYADFMMLITSEEIAVISAPIVVMVVSAHTSLEMKELTKKHAKQLHQRMPLDLTISPYTTPNP
ncbi:hypothetical protein QTP88_023099 [Uroleucon formosanum]